jgi:hypothetical protein
MTVTVSRDPLLSMNTRCNIGNGHQHRRIFFFFFFVAASEDIFTVDTMQRGHMLLPFQRKELSVKCIKVFCGRRLQHAQQSVCSAYVLKAYSQQARRITARLPDWMVGDPGPNEYNVLYRVQRGGANLGGTRAIHRQVWKKRWICHANATGRSTR